MDSLFSKLNDEKKIMNRIKSTYFLYYDVKQRLTEYTTFFNKEMTAYIETNNITLPESIEEKEKEAISVEVESDEKKVPKKARDVYMKVSKKCHPDKTKDEEKIETFNIINTLYKSQDYVGMISIAIFKNMASFDDLKEDEINIKLNEISEKIATMQNTYAWKYFHGDSNFRLDLLNTIVEAHKINAVPEVEEVEDEDMGFDIEFDELDKREFMLNKMKR